jgi:hypothetical protein
MARGIRKRFQDRPEYSELTPAYRITTNGADVQEDVTALVERVTFEDNSFIADMIEIDVILAPDLDADPGAAVSRQYGPLLDSKLFAEGNYVSLFMGYGNDLIFMQRCRIQKWLPKFPESDKPTLKIKAFGVETELSTEMDEDNKQYRSFSGVPYSTMVERIIQWLSQKTGTPILTDIEPTSGNQTAAMAKGKTPMDFIKRLSNLTGYDFYIEYDQDRQAFVAHWHPRRPNQDQQFELIYNQGEDTTLLSFDPQFATGDGLTSLEVISWDRKTNKVIRYSVEKTDKGVDVKVLPGMSVDDLQIQDEVTSASEVIYTSFGDLRKTITTNLTTLDAVKKFAEAEFENASNNMVTGKGRIIGSEVIRAKQKHILKGIGTRLSGEYLFDIVRHTIGSDGYMTEFDCRKLLA